MWIEMSVWIEMWMKMEICGGGCDVDVDVDVGGN